MKFTRPLGNRAYKKIFLLAVEGTKTEPQYFLLFNQRNLSVHIRCVKGGTSPLNLLSRLERAIDDLSLGELDEAWLVTDRDQWTDAHLKKVHRWCERKHNRNLALSNPKFEMWLLLHFENGDKVSSERNCTERLKKHLPEYDKDICERHFSKDKIAKAVERAKQRDVPPCTDWPRAPGTTVYKLVRSILASS